MISKGFLSKRWATRLNRIFWMPFPFWTRPKYHSWAIFRVKKNRQISERYTKNQLAKSPIITAYISLALAKCRSTIDDSVSFAEFFCADGYYAMLARHLGATESHGYDNGKTSFIKVANKMRKRLGLTNVFFHKEDILNINKKDSIDIVANVGGLYHVSDPIKAIDVSYNFCRKYLIIQTVVSMENTAPDYFETPAPHWTWGCRFSRAWLDKVISEKGYDVIDTHFNELEGNGKPVSRGSVYYLIRKSAAR